MTGDHEPRIAKLESELTSIKASLATPSTGDTIDASQITMRINLLQSETNQQFEDLKTEIEKCRMTLKTHVEQDFTSLKKIVDELDKRINSEVEKLSGRLEYVDG